MKRCTKIPYRNSYVPLTLFLILFVFTGNSFVSYVSPQIISDQSNVNTLNNIRYANSDDIEILKTIYGIREIGVDYNKLIDGFGTGFAPMFEKEYDNLLNNPILQTSLNSPSYASELPSTYDLSQDPAFPITGNQGNQGSCTAWALGYYSYGFQEAKENHWNASEGNTNYLMSPSWTYNKVNDGVDDGSSFEGIGMILQQYGSATWKSMPYSDEDYLNWGNETAWRTAPYHRGYELVLIEPSVDYLYLDIIKEKITEGIPINFALDGNQYPEDMWYTEFIISSSDYNSFDLNHAQTIVGYDDLISKDGDIGAFKVVNSWGSSFGINGYYWLTYEAYLKIDQYPYFIEDIPDYSPKLIATWNFSEKTFRSADIKLGIGNTLSPTDEKILEWASLNTEYLPEFMAADLTEFYLSFVNGETQFYLSTYLNRNKDPGEIGEFQIELYNYAYDIGNFDRISSHISSFPISLSGTGIVELINLFPAPQNVSISGNYNTIFLSWDPPDISDGITIMNYSIYRGNSSSSLDFYKNIENVTTFIDSDLILGIEYWYSISAMYSVEEGSHTKPILIILGNLPNEPLNIEIELNINNVFLSWDPPNDDGGVSLINYNIYRWTVEEDRQLIAQIFLDLDYSESLNTTGAVYYCITAVNVIGESNDSEVASVYILDLQTDTSTSSSNNLDTSTSTTTMWSETASVNNEDTNTTNTEDLSDSTKDRTLLITVLPIALGLTTILGIGAFAFFLKKSQ